LSRLVELLHKVHKSPTPLGFGFAQPAPTPKRMLVIARVTEVSEEGLTAAIAASADAVAFVSAPGGQDSRPHPVASAAIPAGLWLEGGASTESQGGAKWDFVVCGPDGPLELLALRDTACFVRVTAGTEGSRLRAMADLGTDAIVLSSEGLDLERILAAVECRRVRLTSGKPVLLQLVSTPTPLQLAVLWRAGVDAIVVDASGQGEALAQARAAAEKAPYDVRSSDGAGPVSIGVHLSHAEEVPVEEREEEDGDEGEPDDDE